MDNHPVQREYRYERKFLISELDLEQVRAVVSMHRAWFGETYPPRYVNNIYLDTHELSCYDANLVGASDRAKVRVRWYGEFFGEVTEPTLEFKIKSGYVGRKRQFPLGAFTVDAHFSSHEFCAWMRAQPALPDNVRARLAGMEVSLLNRYHREYYETRDHCFRLTLDSELTYFKSGKFTSHFLHRRTAQRMVVVEMKYNVENDPAAQRITSVFPFRLSRSSKYVQGIDWLGV